jgi:hypothetical protein
MRTALCSVVAMACSGTTSTLLDEPLDTRYNVEHAVTAVAMDGGFGGGFGCALNLDHTIGCWLEHAGYPAWRTMPPSGEFAQIAAGGGGLYAIATDGSLAGWRGEPPPSGRFRKVTGGTCAIRDDGTIACWGTRDLDPHPPAGTFVDIATAGPQAACAITTDGTIACWGYPQVTPSPPAGTFTRISGGCECAIRADSGSVTCFGLHAATPPIGRFAELSGDSGNTCGLREDGTLACWTCVDDPFYGLGVPPPGRFIAVSVGFESACAVRGDGSIWCWGPGVDEDDQPVQPTY